MPPWIWQIVRLWFSLLRKHKVVVLFTVRQDFMRWALSRYHGDGIGKEAHLQFDIATGDIDADKIPGIWVDPDRFRQSILNCREIEAEFAECKIEFEKTEFPDATCTLLHCGGSWLDLTANIENHFCRVCHFRTIIIASSTDCS